MSLCTQMKVHDVLVFWSDVEIISMLFIYVEIASHTQLL